jgi:hypothetical protein
MVICLCFHDPPPRLVRPVEREFDALFVLLERDVLLFTADDERLLEFPVERTVVERLVVLRLVVERTVLERLVVLRTAEDPEDELGLYDRYCEEELPDRPVDLPEELPVDRPVEPLLPELLTVDFDPPVLEEPLERKTLLPVVLPVDRESIALVLDCVERDGVSSHRVLLRCVEVPVVPFFSELDERVSVPAPEVLNPYLRAPRNWLVAFDD